MTDFDPTPDSEQRLPPWSGRWDGLARAARIAPGERLAVALSGGADSVYLLTVLAEASPAVDVVAIHVAHALRGAESEADAAFCRALAARLGVPFVRAEAPVAPGAGVEERARQARYPALVSAAEQLGASALLTAHHADDAIETLLWRWIRGSALEGLRGAAHERAAGFGSASVRIVRPLTQLRREEVRALLRARDIEWREDSSNLDPAHTRTRIRHGLLPELERLFGRGAVDNLEAFGRAVEDLETALAGRTAHLHWRRPRELGFSRGAGAGGGLLERAPLMRLPVPLRRRVLRRLVTEGTGRSPGQRLLESLVADLGGGRCTRHALPLNFVLWLRSDQLVLVAPAEARHPEPPAELLIPGRVTLADGREIVSSWSEGSSAQPPSHGLAVELDAARLTDRLAVGWPAPGDRFHALGAPGSKRLGRYLAARGVPREERWEVPLVRLGPEILWVAGLDPCEQHRVRDLGARRLRLELIGAPPPS
ncbi:MAG: tRNA lysidine(34) synthetase TilS [Planctomycetota bacterium]